MFCSSEMKNCCSSLTANVCKTFIKIANLFIMCQTNKIANELGLEQQNKCQEYRFEVTLLQMFKCEPKSNEYIMPKFVVLCLSTFQTRIIGKFLIECFVLKTYCSNQWSSITSNWPMIFLHRYWLFIRSIVLFSSVLVRID